MQKLHEVWVWSLGQEDALDWKWPSTPAFLHGESHGQRNLAGFSPWSHKTAGHNWTQTVQYEAETQLPPSGCTWPSDTHIWVLLQELRLTWWLSAKESACNARDAGRRCEFNPWVRKIPWSRKWHPTPIFSPGKSQGQQILVGYSPKGRKRVGHDLVTKQQQQWLNSSVP